MIGCCRCGAERYILTVGVLVGCFLLKRELSFDAGPSFNREAKSGELRTVRPIPLPPDSSKLDHAIPDTPVKNGVAEQANVNHQSIPSAPTGSDASVIGVVFPASASVEASCKRKKLDFCEKQHNVLAEMAKEARDKAWAVKTETLIQDEVISQGPGIYSIRNIECRTSICAAEVESLSDAYVGADYNFLATNGLLDELRMVGAPETDNSGRQISVALVIFTKSFYKNPSVVPGSN
jgi:hypothetical protein